jgi:hypothetical protein
MTPVTTLAPPADAGALFAQLRIAAAPACAVVLEWTADGQLAAIRDFRYARYVMESLAP